jgi:hypothetical protein
MGQVLVKYEIITKMNKNGVEAIEICFSSTTTEPE